MTGNVSKRQLARNERTLQELIKTVPGNNLCADCQALNPAWASWNLGIFLCMRCAGLHRKLGTHISKVKSLTMDSWTNEQVESMKRTGNIASNRTFNPQNAKPPVPFDVDEAESAMERFIRQKYKDNALQGGGRAQPSARQNTGSTESDDHPPPLPPKTGGRFGLRAASSIFPMSSKAKREAAARAYLESNREHAAEHQRSPSPPVRKASRKFSSTDTENLEVKLAQLREMGFMDPKKNEAVLKGQNGNIERTIESLVKLREGSGPSSRSRSPLPPPAAAGASVQHAEDKAISSPRSNNPFDIPVPPSQPSQLSEAQRTAEQQMNSSLSPPLNENNPFGIAPSRSQNNLNQAYMLDQSFQGLGISQQQPLFPNNTGGVPPRLPFHLSTAPPLPSIPQGQYASGFYETPQQQSAAAMNQNYNPFLQSPAAQSPIFTSSPISEFQSNPFHNEHRAQTYPLPNTNYYDQSQPQVYYIQEQQVYTPPPIQPQTNPFALQMQQPQSPGNPFNLQMHPEQLQQQQQQQQQQQYQNQTNNPFGFQPQQQFSQFQQPQQQLLPQQTGRIDKSSIMALFNYPQLAPTPPTPSTQLPPDFQPHLTSPHNVSVSLPTTPVGSRNPFQTSPVSPQGTTFPAPTLGAPPGSAARHVSQESIIAAPFGGSSGWAVGGGGQNGRHSPDAFASLSARSMR